MTEEMNSRSILLNISPNVKRQQNIQDSQSSEKEKQQIFSNKISERQCGKKDCDENTSKSSSYSEQSDDNTAEIVKLSEVKTIPFLKGEKLIPLFIGDLDERVTEKMLKDTFCKFRSLVSVKICVDSEARKSLGYGYLNFLSQDDAERAIDEFSYVTLFGKEIRIMPSMRNSYFRKNIGTNVFFSNLPLENLSLTTRAFYDTFKNFGNILSCKLDRRKNIGFVYFENDDSAKRAIEEYNNKDYFGNVISCGIHFDRDIRKSPEFEKRKARLHGMTIIKEKLLSEDYTELQDGELNNRVPHPNAIFVKNLPLNVTKEEILNYFSRIGPVKSVFTSKVSNYNSSWAFVTYKNGCDTKDAIKEINGTVFLERRIEVSKAQKSHANPNHENSLANSGKEKSFLELCEDKRPIPISGGYRQTIYLSNLSTVCTEDFLTCLCHKEKIRYRNISVQHYDNSTLTYFGTVVCSSKSDALRLFQVMDKRLFGDSLVSASWQPPKQTTLVHVAGIEPEIRDAKKSQHFRKESGRSENGRIIGKESEILDVFPLSTLNHESLSSKSKSFQTKKDAVARAQLMDVLRTQVYNSIDFMKHPSATRDENLKCITEYIFDVYWRSDLSSLTRFMLLMSAKPQHERILHKQVQEAIDFLGFQR